MMVNNNRCYEPSTTDFIPYHQTEIFCGRYFAHKQCNQHLGRCEQANSTRDFRNIGVFIRPAISYFPHVHAGKVSNDYKLNGLYILTQRPGTKQYDRHFIAYSASPISYIYKVNPNNFEPRRLHEHNAGVRDEYVNFNNVQILARIEVTPDIIRADGVNVYVPKNIFARAVMQSVFGRRLLITNKSIALLIKLTKQY